MPRNHPRLKPPSRHSQPLYSRHASAGNRARVTSMATMYSTTRPLMLEVPDISCLLYTVSVWCRAIQVRGFVVASTRQFWPVKFPQTLKHPIKLWLGSRRIFDNKECANTHCSSGPNCEGTSRRMGGSLAGVFIWLATPFGRRGRRGHLMQPNCDYDK